MWRALAEPWGAGGNNSCVVCEFGSESTELSAREGGGWSAGERGRSVQEMGAVAWADPRSTMPPEQLGTVRSEGRPCCPTGFSPCSSALQLEDPRRWECPLYCPHCITQHGQWFPPQSGWCLPTPSPRRSTLAVLELLTFSLQVHVGFGRLWAALFLPAPSPLWWPLQATTPRASTGHHVLMIVSFIKP